MAPKSPENLGEQAVDWQKFSQAVDKFLVIMDKEIPKKDADVLRRMSLLAEVQKDTASASQLLLENNSELRAIILKALTENKLPPEVAQEILKPFGENQIMTELFAQYGHGYEHGSTDNQTTDCVQILRDSPTFRALTEQNPSRFFSEGSDLVLDEHLGRVVDTVDRENFVSLSKYKPTKDKMYVFGLTKPPLYFGGKPNVTHLQIPTGMNTDPGKLSVIHASSDKGSVTMEEDITQYLTGRNFERVYVIEIDLKKPYSDNLYERTPFFKHKDNEGHIYERPAVYDVPLVMDKFELINPKKEVPIYLDEKRVLEIATDNRALEYLTVLTGMREGKIGQTQNATEAAAFEAGLDPVNRSLGLHQVTKVVYPLFNTWLETLPQNKAEKLGAPFTEWWKEKQQGKDIAWEKMIPYLNSYNFVNQSYDNVAVSTICSYLLIKHLYEDQLMGAYRNYGETFFGIEEQPESIIAIAGGYRANIDVMVTGSQQYRVAELGYQSGLLDADFQFTEEAKHSPIYAEYLIEVRKKSRESKQQNTLENGFSVDGYRGVQMQYVAYMIYKKHEPNGPIQFSEFTKAYGTSQANLLSEKNDAVAEMRKIYFETFNKKPHLLMTEDELREVGTAMHTNKIKFGNEGLWVLSHYEKLTKNNWDIVSASGEGKTENAIVERALTDKSIETNEISKIPPEQGQRFYNLIKNLPGNPWYTKYPEYIMSACFVKGYFGKESKDTGDGKWIKETEAFINETFGKNIPILQKRLADWHIADKKVFVELASASALISIDEIVAGIEKEGSPLNFLSILEKNQNVQLSAHRLNLYTPSFSHLMSRFTTKDSVSLERKEQLSEKEQRAAFAIRVFNAAQSEALARGLTIDFAMVATSQACLESAWGKNENELGEPTLLAAGTNNIFGVKDKGNYKEYNEEDYLRQSGEESFYIHHTKEYDEKTDSLQWQYGAFAKYDSIEDSVKGYFDLIEGQYDLAIEMARDMPATKEPNAEREEKIFDAIDKGGYSTDEDYVSKALAVSNSVTSVLRQYGVII